MVAPSQDLVGEQLASAGTLYRKRRWMSVEAPLTFVSKKYQCFS
jgi:hypothetical protein